MQIKSWKIYVFCILLTALFCSCLSMMVGNEEIIFPITGTFEFQNSFSRDQNGIIEITDVTGNNFSGYFTGVNNMIFHSRTNISGSYNPQTNLSIFTCFDLHGQEWTFIATMARGGRNFYQGQAQLTHEMINGRFQTRETVGGLIQPLPWQAWLVQ